jgi:hypothetical protein
MRKNHATAGNTAVSAPKAATIVVKAATAAAKAAATALKTGAASKASAPPAASAVVSKATAVARQKEAPGTTMVPTLKVKSGVKRPTAAELPVMKAAKESKKIASAICCGFRPKSCCTFVACA